MSPVHSNILLFSKSNNQKKSEACSISTDFNLKTSIDEYFNLKKVILNDLTSEIWNILSLEEYEIKKREMPKMFVSEPISRYYNAKIGQIFTIIRSSEISGQAPYHRLVIKGNYIDK